MFTKGFGLDLGHNNSFSPFNLIELFIFQFGEDSSTSSMMSVNFDVPANQSDISDLVRASPVAHSVLWIWGRDSGAYRVSSQRVMKEFSQTGSGSQPH